MPLGHFPQVHACLTINYYVLTVYVSHSCLHHFKQSNTLHMYICMYVAIYRLCGVHLFIQLDKYIVSFNEVKYIPIQSSWSDLVATYIASYS